LSDFQKFSWKLISCFLNPLYAELNPICQLLALLRTHHIFHVSGLRVNVQYENNRTHRHDTRHLQWSSLAAFFLKSCSLNKKGQKVFGNSACILLHITYIRYRHASITVIRGLQWGVVIFRAQLAFWLLANMQMKKPHRLTASAARMLPALTLQFIQKVRQ
jgi:hypothetical protein